MLYAADFEPLRPPLAFIRNGVEFEITLIARAADGAIVTPGFEGGRGTPAPLVVTSGPSTHFQFGWCRAQGCWL